MPEAQLRVLLRQWLADKRAATKTTYRSDLQDFAAWAGFEGDDEALAWLLSLPGPALNGQVLAYREDLLTRDVGRRRPGVAPATVNRRLSALRSFTRLARTVGYTTATIEIRGVKVRPYRDTSGVGHGAYLRIITELEERSGNDPKAARDALVVRLLHDVALRRSEVVRLDMRDCRPDRRSLWIQGKTDDAEVDVTDDVWWALETWLEHRGHHEGPIVTTSRVPRLGFTRTPARLDVSTINRIVADAGNAVGIRGVNPHGFRHSATTELLDRTGGDVRRVAGFTRHAKKETVFIYDDARRRDVRAMQALISAPHPRRK